MLDKLLQTIDQGQNQSIEGLKQFLRLPSVSTDARYAADVVGCANWLADTIRKMGLDAQVHPSAGHPVVVACNDHKPGRPTILFYGHYDVQPPDPLDQWITPPFEPTIRDGAIYARGAADDKGQVWAHLQAIRTWQENGGLPVNLTMLIEGEEEIGSASLPAFIKSHRELLAADVALASDTHQYARGLPAISYALRGIVFMEITLTGPSHDLHSGIYGGSVPNVANVMTELLSTLHDEHGRVAIDGFYDDVLPLTDTERQMWKKLPFDESHFAAGLGLSPAQLTGETGFTALERQWARPTCDINGITSGYQGPGAKTIIPATATAKISMRLVPNQDPAKIAQLAEQTLRKRCPDTVKIQISGVTHSPPILVPHEGAPIRAAIDAMKTGFKATPTLIRCGGTLHVVPMIKSLLGIDTLLVGFGLPDDRVHSPNEKFDLEALHCGTRTATALYQNLAGVDSFK
ncbi:MAG: dipeptidase [Phycisphaerales bacterium]|jgi:acetylornithine deacetylase/succinyl-diaminopimelate desuccinylase-like protein|nr:dipeptidase [Phycisphaerales bacterium]